jgi:hypothetical protein
MGKKDKAKAKNKAALGPGDIQKQADDQGFEYVGNGAAYAGDWGAIPEEKMEHFGSTGWGESPIEEEVHHQTWRPSSNADHWEDAQAQNIRTLHLSRGQN